jgi:hypothetical protein
MNDCSKTLRFVLMWTVFLFPCQAADGQVPVRHTEGLVHGFLVLRTLEGETLAHGDLIQMAHADRVTAHLIFHFKDGSLHDETAVYSQLRSFRLLRYHLVQKGPSFSSAKDLSIDVPSGQVTVRYPGDDGKEQVKIEYMKLPPDLANGVLFTLMKNMPPGSNEMKAAMVVTTPKPRIVGLAISAQGEDTFVLGGNNRKATHYIVKIEIGGVTGLVAPVLGKQPPDTHVWILQGEAPAFVRSRGPLFSGGPTWQIELESPVWPDRADGH